MPWLKSKSSLKLNPHLYKTQPAAGKKEREKIEVVAKPAGAGLLLVTEQLRQTLGQNSSPLLKGKLFCASQQKDS